MVWCDPVVSENRRTKPPQRLDTDDERKIEDAPPVVGVTAPEEGAGDESYSGECEW